MADRTIAHRPLVIPYLQPVDPKEQEEERKKRMVENERTQRAPALRPAPGVFHLNGLPCEVLANVAGHLNSSVDIANMRCVSRKFNEAVRLPYWKHVVSNYTFYPRYEDFRCFILLLLANEVLQNYVTNINLVCEGMRMPDFGYEWAWENLQHRERLFITKDDFNIIEEVNHHHARYVFSNDEFITGGQYRQTVEFLLLMLPSLETIHMRRMRMGEHQRGWAGADALKQLSFWHPKLDTTSIFYRNWKYDTVHFRVTQYIDEYGEEITETHAGPQARFSDDLYAAMQVSKTKARVFYRGTRVKWG